MARLGKAWPGFELRAGEEYRAYDARCRKLIDEIRAKHQIVKFPVADGYALYAVTSEKPLVLRHIPYGDAYQAAAATIRGLTMRDVEAQRKFDEFFEKQGDENEAFYASLKPGQVVHYHNGFGQYIRCTVVREGGKTALKETALVGAWREYDLPKRELDGSVRLGHHADGIAEGRTITPHMSCIWESGKDRRFPDDPATLEPIDLSVPEMSPEEAERARLWRKVARVRALVSQQHRDLDPGEILAAVAEAAA